MTPEASKLLKVIPAFKISEEMHAEVSRSAKRHHAKLVDHIRFLIAQGLKLQGALDANEGRVLRDVATPTGAGAPAKKEKKASHSF